MDILISGSSIEASTFQCSTKHGIEYGWQFNKLDHEDVLFDIVLGLHLEGMDPVLMENRWRDTQWVAQAVVDAAPKDIND